MSVFSRNSQLVTITVDDEVVSGITPGSNIGLDVGSIWYAGGITSDVSEYEYILDGVYSTGLIGCLRQLEVNGVILDVEKDARNGRNVDSCEQ